VSHNSQRRKRSQEVRVRIVQPQVIRIIETSEVPSRVAHYHAELVAALTGLLIVPRNGRRMARHVEVAQEAASGIVVCSPFVIDIIIGKEMMTIERIDPSTRMDAGHLKENE
jgi:hypothetical protein